MSDPLLQITLLAVLVVAVVTDVRCCRIPNWLTIPAMAFGLSIHTVLDGQHGLFFSLEGLAVGVGLFIVFYATGGMGAGDVKLMAAVGSFLGPISVLYAGVMTMLLGGVYAAMTMVAGYGLQGSLVRVRILLTTLALPKNPSHAGVQESRYQLRYAMVIGLGTMLTEMFIVP